MLLPWPDLTQVWLDFDGTLTQSDVLDELITRFAVTDAWRSIERCWRAGLIGSHECLRREFALLRVWPDELRRFLAGIRLDPGGDHLLQVLAAYQVPVAILSDGVDLFIRKLLGRARLRNVVVRANTVVRRGNRLELICPHHSPQCEVGAAHCKCESAQILHQPGRQTIYIGDGRSDLCPARKAAFVFAKGVLAEELRREDRPFVPFETLDTVAAVLETAWLRASLSGVDSLAQGD